MYIQPPRTFDIFSPFRNKDVLIAVMGATGSGKSTFINLVSGSNFQVSDDLESCTQSIQVAPAFKLGGNKIKLIDTPGFDDSERSEVEILQIIAKYLKDQYQNKTMLHGVIYLHRISDVRMGGSSRRTFEMLLELCGEKTLQNVVIATTMWSAQVQAIEVKRESQLKEDEKFFKYALSSGAKYTRHENTIDSARGILNQIIINQKIPLKIQQELVDERKLLHETSAGQEVYRHMSTDIEKVSQNVEELKMEIAEARRRGDDQTVQELQEDFQYYADAQRQLQEQTSKFISGAVIKCR